MILFTYLELKMILKIYKTGIQNTHTGYADWAVKRYSLYKKLIENEDILNVPYDKEKLELYKELL